MKLLKDTKGLTLTELLVAMSVFLILVAFMYPTFSFIGRQNDYINASESIAHRGQRIIDYLAEDIRMAGFVVGPKDNIRICPGFDTEHPSSGVAAIRLNDNYDTNGRYDALTFLTSVIVEVDQNKASCITGQDVYGTTDYELDVASNAAIGDTSITVDASRSCIATSLINPNSITQNAKALIAFETASQISNIYTVTDFSNNIITLTPGLELAVTTGSPVYAVREYRYDVVADTTGNVRELRRSVLAKNCVYSPVVIDPVSGENGGIDGLQYEFISINRVTGELELSSTLPTELGDLKAIRIWLLVRSSVPDRFYTDTDADPSATGIQNYVLGTDDGTGSPVTGVTIAPFGDHYRRLLLNKTVEVKNLAS